MYNGDSWFLDHGYKWKKPHLTISEQIIFLYCFEDAYVHGANSIRHSRKAVKMVWCHHLIATNSSKKNFCNLSHFVIPLFFCLAFFASSWWYFKGSFCIFIQLLSDCEYVNKKMHAPLTFPSFINLIKLLDRFTTIRSR